MPTHDFRCAACGHEFEAERPLLHCNTRVDCPGCGSAKTVKVFGAAGIVFNCGGFYTTDSKQSPKPQETKHGRPIQ